MMYTGRVWYPLFKGENIKLFSQLWHQSRGVVLCHPYQSLYLTPRRSIYFFEVVFIPSAHCASTLSVKRIASSHRLHDPFLPQMDHHSPLLVPHSARRSSEARPHVHDLDWDKRHTYFTPPLRPATHSFFSFFLPVWLIQPWVASGIMGSQRGPSLELFQPGSGWVSPACFITARHWAIHKSLS